MAETRVNNYEGMFLLGQAAASDFGGAISHIRQIIEKAGGKIAAMRKWDERRLAFEIDKQKRGIYILVYFSCPAQALATIERSCNLSEQVLRELIIRADHLTPDEVLAADAQKELEAEAKLRASQPQMAVAATPVPAAGAEEEESEEV